MASGSRSRDADPRRLTDFSRRGLAEHHGYGLYRINLIPPGNLDEFMLAAAWPNGHGVLSHETALDLYDVCDINPNHIDITVPPGYRTHRDVPSAYRLHPRDLAPDDITWFEGLPIVTPSRAIADAIQMGLRDGQLEQAIGGAERQALITAAAARGLRGGLGTRTRSGR